MNADDALAQMRGKTIGALLRPDGSARLQWPNTDGTLPDDMSVYTVAGVRIEGGAVALDLTSPVVSFTFYFNLSAIMR